MSEQIAPELVERMVALVRRLADKAPYSPESCAAHDIAKLLPEPVDPDLIEVRVIAAEQARARGSMNDRLPTIAAGDADDWFETQFALAALKRGRELAKGSSL